MRWVFGLFLGWVGKVMWSEVVLGFWVEDGVVGVLGGWGDCN